MAEAGPWEGRKRARRRALQALYQWQLNPTEPGDLVDQFLEAQDFSGVDQDLFRRLVLGVIDTHESLAARLQPCMDRPLTQCDVMERVVLLLGAWQLLHDRELPARVVLDESVALAARFGSEQGRAYVNAVLDRAARDWGTDAGRP